MGSERRPRERHREPGGKPGSRRADRREARGPDEEGRDRRAWYDEGFDAFHRSIRTPRLKELDDIERRRYVGRRREPMIPPHIARRYAPGKPARGYDPRGIHTYDLDYGRQGGGPSEYSGRAGYPSPDPIATGDLPANLSSRGGRPWRVVDPTGFEPGEDPRGRARRLRERRRGPGRASGNREEGSQERESRWRRHESRRRPSASAYEERHWSAAEPASRAGDRRDPYRPGRREGDRFPRPGGRHRWREPRRRR